MGGARAHAGKCWHTRTNTHTNTCTKITRMPADCARANARRQSCRAGRRRFHPPGRQAQVPGLKLTQASCGAQLASSGPTFMRTHYVNSLKVLKRRKASTAWSGSLHAYFSPALHCAVLQGFVPEGAPPNVLVGTDHQRLQVHFDILGSRLGCVLFDSVLKQPLLASIPCFDKKRRL